MPSQHASEQAKFRLAALEAKPEHRDGDDNAHAQSRVDDLKDPDHNGPEVDVDPGWHKDAKGHWTHPDFEGDE